MAPATLKEPETPRVPGILKSDAQDSDPIAFSTRGRAALSLLKPTPSVSEPGPPSLSHQHRSDWTPQEDHMLIRAHAQGYSWWRINEEVFPTKSPIAVNQRYQRLQRMLEAKEKTPETREAKERPPSVGSTDHLSSWNKPKFQRLAREYMKQRKQIWSSFAAHVGADWEDVEDAVNIRHRLPRKCVYGAKGADKASNLVHVYSWSANDTEHSSHPSSLRSSPEPDQGQQTQHRLCHEHALFTL